MQFDRIVSRFQKDGVHSFEFASPAGTSVYDYTRTYVVPAMIDFHGFQESDDDMDEYDFDAMPKIGTITGVLLLCRQMDEDGHDFYTVCDDVSGDLEHLASVILKEGLPDDDFQMNPQDIFYIEELEIQPEYQRSGLGSRILAELPTLIWAYLHVKPGVLAYIPTPLEGPEEPLDERDQEIFKILMDRAARKMNALFQSIIEPEKTKTNIVQLPTENQIDEDDIKRVLGRRVEESAHSNDRRNEPLLTFYEASGFVEIAKTQVMVRMVYV
ncbi:hypothetical protein LJC74_08225 [Eubacteriales bacterium OttesenSCG-928-A19]|nr:hypothetical protein [Eubacteriales bacterium OttesenSCG-928-A19]